MPMLTEAPSSAALESPAESEAAAETMEPCSVSSETIASRVEAVLLTSDRPLTASRIAETIAQVVGGAIEGAQVESAVASLNEVYDDTGRSFRIERVAGGYRMMTRPEFGAVTAATARARDAGRLSQAALETLSIVAYRQPITRADIEAIRGVACGDILRSLLERRLVKIVGRAEELGRPMLYGTGREFLEAFGLASLKDLPDSRELRQG